MVRRRLLDFRPIVVFRLPADLAQALNRRPPVREYWNQLYETTQQSYIRFLLGARNLQTRHQRTALIVQLMASAYRRTHGWPE